ncbi:unnamed protein product [Gemmata massiliana]|uniref:Uncharacterized protein n=1 Tax=Gemmata massiliana TaxID=1210884 RepID=A0A6P2D4D7_9BACT|nr:unnamed protein product [Gemmata massiliana]
MARQRDAQTEPAQQTGPVMTAQEREELEPCVELMLSEPHKRNLGGGSR